MKTKIDVPSPHTLLIRHVLCFCNINEYYLFYPQSMAAESMNEGDDGFTPLPKLNFKVSAAGMGIHVFGIISVVWSKESSKFLCAHTFCNKEIIKLYCYFLKHLFDPLFSYPA